MNPQSDPATTVPRFVRSVYDMLQNEDQRILSWSADGSHFQVYDVPRLETEVLRKYFKHGKFSSFQRQLNNFGFHKWTKTRASVPTFSHTVLVRCQPSQLAALVSQMQKKVSTTPTKSSMTAKRPRSLLASTTMAASTHATITPTVIPASKKQKMSPRDVSESEDLYLCSLSFSPLWASTDCYNEDEPLFDALDAIELVDLDWDSVTTPVATDDCGSGCVNAISVDVNAELHDGCGTSDLDLLGEEDVLAILGDLETAAAPSGCELEALLGGASCSQDEADLTICEVIEFDIAVAAGVDTLLFV